ncbi:MAG: MarR family transcriptional regulator [Flavobacteriales bacterium]|nr:MarR family transcriptional regulator [Flavobacteriales bacterium]|tara:strand:- start:10 stop:456 length:447 start_codon:yes stop_codon:yes gene_type:complete
MTPQETVDYHIKCAWLCISNFYAQIAEQHELSQTSGFVLMNIHEKEGTPATKIAPMMGMKATSLSRILKKMEEEKLICRKDDAHDKRSVRIHLTDKGREKKIVAKKVVKEFNEYIIDRLNKNKLNSFFSVMQDIGELTEEYKNLKIAK